MSDSNVLIIGGGIGGLALAHGLKRHNIPFHVFERDRTESYRAQGYRIRIGGPAIDALEYLLDADVMSDFNLSCAKMDLAAIPEIDAESARVDEPKVGAPGAGTNQETNAMIASRGRTVDRGALREVLIKHLDPDTVSFDKRFTHYEESEHGMVAYFEDGMPSHGALLVGADGRNSKVRQQLLPDLKVLPSGSHCIYGKTHLTPPVLKELNEIAAKHMSFVKDRSREEIMAMALEPIRFLSAAERRARGLSVPEDYLFWVLTAAATPLGFSPANANQHLSLAESEQRALEVTKHWHPSLRTIIEHQAKGETAAFSIEIVAKDFTERAWKSNARVTLIGDAVHPVAATGSGAVMALTDAQTLCSGLVAKNDEVGYESVIEQYEQIMRHVAGQAIPASWGMVNAMTGMTRSNEMHIGEMATKMRARNIAKMQK